jgi:hypothetical protein
MKVSRLWGEYRTRHAEEVEARYAARQAYANNNGHAR